MARPRGKKRTAAEAAAIDSSKPEAAAAKEPAAARRGRGKRVKAAPPRPEDYFPEKRNLVSGLHDDLSGRRASVCY